MRYLMLAREDLSSYVEERVLMTIKTNEICQFVLEDIISRHGYFHQMRADRGKMDTKEVIEFFVKYRTKLKLTSSYNLEENGRSSEVTSRLRTLSPKHAIRIWLVGQACCCWHFSPFE